MDIDSFKFLFRGYSHKEWAEVTGYNYRTLVKLASEGNPGWKRQRWWPIPFALWTAGLISTPRQGRKQLVDANLSSEILPNIIKLSEKYAKINQSNS